MSENSGVEQTVDAAETSENEEDLKALLNTYISKEDADKELSDIDVKKMNLLIIRQKWQTQVTQIQMNISALDEKILELDGAKAIVFRRALNTPDKSAEAFKNAKIRKD